MKRFYLLAFSLLLQTFVLAQNFTWMKGTNTGGQIGAYGTQGVSSGTNNPGCRHGSATWVDSQGNLWMFGGEGYSNNNTLCWLNDLWKYDVLTNEWTWISGANTANQPGVYGNLGVASTTNHPGAREFMLSWTDASGNFWLFGGDGFASNTTFGKLNDLWRYNPSTGQWTWMKGSNTVDQNGVYGTLGLANALNTPGSRSSSGAWMDGLGNLWLFGGRGLPASGTSTGFLNDLWKYSVSTNQWTWVSGSNLLSQPSIYGTLNVAAASNIPGGLEFPGCWINGSDLYLFGGRGFPGTGAPSYLNTFWKYSISLNEWTWIGGSNSTMATGNYGTLGLPSVANIPGARMSPATWVDDANYFWIFGGEGNGSSSGLGALNDLFRYNILNGEWTWVKGANITDQLGIYGTQSVSSATNMPGARYYNTYWPNTDGKLWLMGGYGFSNSSFGDNMEDLWKFYPSCNPESVIALPSSTLCSGSSATLFSTSSGTQSVSWYTVPSAGSSVASGTQISIPNLQAVAGNSVYTYYSESLGCSSYPRSSIQLTVVPSPSIQLSASNSICSGDIFTCTASGSAISYTWSNGSNLPTLSLTLSAGTTFTVSGTGSNGCTGQNTITALVLPLPTVNIAGPTSLCAGNSAVLIASGSASSYTWSTGSTANSITINPGSSGVFLLTGKDSNNCESTSSHSVTVLDLPVVSILSKSVMCEGEAATLSGTGAVTYTWNTGQTTSNITVSPALTTTFSVAGTAANSCSNIAQFTLSVHPCLSIEKQEATTQTLLFAYPNPSSGHFFIKASTVPEGRICVFNALGQVVFSESTPSTNLELQLSSGVYFCILYSEQRALKTIKLVVE